MLCFLSLCLFSYPDSIQAKSLSAERALTDSNKNILVLYSYNNNIPSQQNFTAGLEKARKTFNLRSGNFFHEYLDISLKDQEERNLLRNLLLKKYAGMHFDLIVTLYDPALDFLLNEGKDLSPESHCLSIFNLVRPGLWRAGKKVIQFPLHYDLSGTLALSLKLFPQTRKVLIILGASKTDVAFENRARAELLPWKNKLEFEYTTGISVDEVLKKVAHLSPHTVVISSRIESDITGKVFVPRDVAVMLARASNAPVFCLVSTQLDAGMVGGSMIDFEDVGAMLGGAVVTLARGKILTLETVSKYTKPMFNWQQIKRWKINPKDLPVDSLIINRPLSPWTRYKNIVAGVIVVFFVLTSFIIALLIQNRRRATAEKSALESESRFRVLFKHAPDAIMVYDHDLARLVDVNVSAEKLFGCSRDKLMQLLPLEFYPPGQPDKRDVSKSYQEHLEQALAEKTVNFERVIHTADGRDLFCEVHLIRLPSEKRRLIRASYIDITERKRAEAERKNLEYQLQQSQKMEVLGTLAGGIAHDFNNILFPIIGFTEMLIDSEPEDSDSRQSLNEILKASLRAADLVQQILAFSRQSEIELIPLKTQIIFNDTIKLMRATIPSTITIESAIDEDCGMVLASETHIHQIAMNLMTNAFHAMEDIGGTMGISLSEVEITVDDLEALDVYPGRFLRYTVSDTGHGIGKYILDKIFDPYFTTKKAGKGTGLGLSVVQGIVKSYGGDIRVSSELGTGTEFHVYLPLIDKDDDVNPAAGYHLQNNKGNEHILLVDDEAAILRMEKKMLEQMGYRVSTCSNSLDALELFRSSSDAYDLVITDMTMPDLTGEKFAVELKQIRKDIPVILCTGFSSKISVGTAESMGVDGFLMKPVGKKDLLKTIRSLLDGKKES